MSQAPIVSVAKNIQNLITALEVLVKRVDELEKAHPEDVNNPNHASLQERVKDIEDMLWGDAK